MVDFAELMLRSYELLRDNAPIRASTTSGALRHILVDEFQDTNRLQYAWIKVLAGTTGRAVHRARRVRGGRRRPEHLRLPRRARRQHGRLCEREFTCNTQIKLEQNYRSHSNILDSANALISHNRKRLGKNLRTDQGPGEPVRVFEATSDFAEAQWYGRMKCASWCATALSATRSQCSTAATRRAG